MATQITNFQHIQQVTNIDTYNYTLTIAGQHKLKISMTDIPASGMTITALRNGSSLIATTSAPAAAQSHVEVNVAFNGAIGDTLAITFASAVPGDTSINRFSAFLQLLGGMGN